MSNEKMPSKKTLKIKFTKYTMLAGVFLLGALTGAVKDIINKNHENFELVFVCSIWSVFILWLGRCQRLEKEKKKNASDVFKGTEKSKNTTEQGASGETNISKEPQISFIDLFENATFAENDNQMEFFAISQGGIPHTVVYELRKDDNLQVIRSKQITFAKLRAAAKQAMESAELFFVQERLKLFSMMEEYNWESILNLSQSLDDWKGNAKVWASQRKGWSFQCNAQISHVTLPNYLGCDIRLDCTEEGCTATLIDHIRDEHEYTREISIRLPQAFPTNVSANDLAKLLNCLPPSGPYQEDSGPYRNIKAKELQYVLRETWKDYEGNKRNKKHQSCFTVRQSSQSRSNNETVFQVSQASKLQDLREEQRLDSARTVKLKTIPVPSSDKSSEGLQSSFAPFRYRLAMQSRPYIHRLDSCASQDKNWEIEILGIDLNSGRPYLELSRQKSFGFVLGSEEETRPLSEEEYQKALHRFPNAPSWAKKLNQNNWKTFLEEPLKLFDQRCQDRMAVHPSTLHGPFPKPQGKPVQRVTVTLQ